MAGLEPGIQGHLAPCWLPLHRRVKPGDDDENLLAPLLRCGAAKG
jgi:hypothetical protein